MGRWSRHPMGSDGALDAQYCFLMNFDEHYLDKDPKEISEYLLGLSLEDLKKVSESNKYLSIDKFVIPYTYVEYGAFTKDPEVRKYLLECLDSHDDITGRFNYCHEKDVFGDVPELVEIERFKKHFDEIFDEKVELELDDGLLAAIEKTMDDPGYDGGLINKR